MATTCADRDASRVCHQGLAYLWHEGAFLTRPEAEYAIERLWALCAGSADWSGEPVLSIVAASHQQVVQMHRLDAGQLEWIPLEAVLPLGHSLGLDTARLPGLCVAAPSRAIHFTGKGAVPLDLVAATFLMLSRWEEAEVPREPDPRGNYPENGHLAARQGFLDRPVLDEWALVLRAWLAAMRPGWHAEPKPARIVMTHDVDATRKFSSWYQVPRATAGALLRTGSLGKSLQAALLGVRSRFNPTRDPYHRGITSLLDFDETLGLQGTFFLMAAEPGPLDRGYDLAGPEVLPLVQEILDRGHEVGWHPGYRAAEDEERFHREKRRLDARLKRPVLAARFHFLRWRPQWSWRRLVEAGIAFDSTLGFNETVGFRCGTAHPFPVWDRTSGERLPLEERPLVIQDETLLACTGLDPGEAQRRGKVLLERVRRVNGDLTVLIHNSLWLQMDTVLEVFRQALR